MNYQKIYDQLITRAKDRVIEGYTEKHHIIPRCQGGTNEKENIAILTGREHFIAHHLLHLIYPDNKKLFYAFWAMCNQKTGKRYYTVSSKLYQRVKEEFSILQSIRAKEYMTGKKRPEHSKALTGRKNPRHSEFMSAYNKGRKFSEETKRKISEKNKGRITSPVKPVVQYTLEGEFIKEYPSIAEALRQVGSSVSITSCLKGRLKSTGGCIWRYKN